MVDETKKPKAAAKFPEPIDREKVDAMAKVALRPNANAAILIKEYGNPFGELDLMALADSLSGTVNDVCGGDLKQCEAMLIGQAHALQAIFTNLSWRAIKSEHMDSFERFLRLGLKAQSQCRTTLETLAAIKNPPVVYARQANIAHGPQQVNNGTGSPGRMATTPAEKGEPEQNKLLEVQDGQRLDARTEGTAGGTNPTMATLDKIDRSPHG